MSRRDQAPPPPRPEPLDRDLYDTNNGINANGVNDDFINYRGGGVGVGVGVGGLPVTASASSSFHISAMDAEYDYKASSPQSPGTLKPTAKVWAGSPAGRGAAATANTVDGEDALLDLAQLEELHKEAEKMKALGNKHMASQEYTRAYNAYSAALQLSPVGPSSHVFLSNRAAALLSLKRYQAAATDARRAIALAPTFGKAHARLGQALYFLKDYDGAVAAYRDAVQYEPGNQVTQTYLEKATSKLERRKHLQNSQQPTSQQQPAAAAAAAEDDAAAQALASPASAATATPTSASVLSGEEASTTPLSVITSDRHRTGMIESFGVMRTRTVAAHADNQPNITSPSRSAAALVRAVAAGAGGDGSSTNYSSPSSSPPRAAASSAAPAAPAPSSLAGAAIEGNPASGAAGQPSTADESSMGPLHHHDPDVEEALRIQARANRYLAGKEYVRAIEEYTAALFLVPDDPILSPNLHLGRAHALNGCRRHERARTDAIMALRLQPSPAAYSTLAKSLFYLRDYTGSIDAFKACTELLPPGEQLGMFDRAYLAKAEAALEDEEASLRRAGMIHGGDLPGSPSRVGAGAHQQQQQQQHQPRGAVNSGGSGGVGATNSSNRSILSVGGATLSGSVVPKLPPPRFVPREQALAQAPVVPPMPREWPRQSADAPKDAVRCGPEHTVEFLSESLGIKLNRGADGFVRVLWVAREDASSLYLARRGGPIEVGHVVREAAGVDLRRPITNVMWGDTVALVKMAPRPITLVVARELSDVPAPVLEEIKRANGGTIPSTVNLPSNLAAAVSVSSPLAAAAAAAAGS